MHSPGHTPNGDAPRPSGSLLSRQSFPVFAIFFMWGLGTGALWVARPLFAYALSNSVFLVGLISAASAAPRALFGPLTGYLADRWGRRPLILVAAIGHGLVLVGQFLSDNYLQYVLLEVVAGTAIVFWNVSSNALIADITSVDNRGRGVAVRNISQRAGMLAGPAVSGIIAALFGLRYVFLFIAATKVVVLLITLFLIKETRPQELRGTSAAGRRKRERLQWGVFRDRSFIALTCATVAYGMIGVGPGVFRTFFPVHAEVNAGLGPAEIGNLVSIAGFVTLAVTLPIGVLLDRHGRKQLLFIGMVVTAASAYIMALTGNFPMALAAVIVFGAGEGVNTGSVQTYAMDLAPPEHRGMFLGIWHMSMNTGQFLGPLGIGLIANLFGMTIAFTVMACIVAAAAAAVLLLARETKQRTPAKRA